MSSAELERLADRGYLKREPPARAELEGLIRSGATRLAVAATSRGGVDDCAHRRSVSR